MSQDRLEVCLGNPAELLPYLGGRGDVLVLDLTCDAQEEWQTVLPIWPEAGLRRVIVVVPTDRDPRPLLAVTPGKYAGVILLTSRYVAVRGAQERGHVVHLFGSLPAVSHEQAYTPAQVRLRPRDMTLPGLHEAACEWGVQHLVLPHETLVDPHADSGTWTTLGVRYGRKVIALTRSEQRQQGLRMLSTHRYLFEPGWTGEEEGQ